MADVYNASLPTGQLTSSKPSSIYPEPLLSSRRNFFEGAAVSSLRARLEGGKIVLDR
jgi:hypothetical protein